MNEKSHAGEKRPAEAEWLERFPPFLSMRIRVLELDAQWRRVRILLPLDEATRNPGGSMFGGCMASLADPIAALACAGRFPDYSVWTRYLELDFFREGRTDLELRFLFEPAQHRAIAEALQRHGRCTPLFEYAFHLADGRRCARVRNRVAIRKKGEVAGSRGALA